MGTLRVFLPLDMVGTLRVFLPTRAMGTLRVFLPLDMVRRDAEEHGRREEPLSRGGVPG